LSSGVAVMRHKATAEDRTPQVVNSPHLSRANRPPRIEEMARAGGLEKLYTLLYGFMSILAHGNLHSSLMEPEESFMIMNIASVRSLLMRCTELLLIVSEING
jgi:hypothetical protein